MVDDEFLEIMQECIDDSEQVLSRYKRKNTDNTVNMAIELFKARIYLTIMRSKSFPQYG